AICNASNHIDTVVRAIGRQYYSINRFLTPGADEYPPLVMRWNRPACKVHHGGYQVLKGDEFVRPAPDRPRRQMSIHRRKPYNKRNAMPKIDSIGFTTGNPLTMIGKEENDCAVHQPVFPQPLNHGSDLFVGQGNAVI